MSANKLTAMAAIEVLSTGWAYGDKPSNEAFDEIARGVDECRAKETQALLDEDQADMEMQDWVEEARRRQEDES